MGDKIEEKSEKGEICGTKDGSMTQVSDSEQSLEIIGEHGKIKKNTD